VKSLTFRSQRLFCWKKRRRCELSVKEKPYSPTWRTDSLERYYREGDTLTDQQSGVSVRLRKKCELIGQDSFLVCGSLLSAHLLFALGMVKIAREFGLREFRNSSAMGESLSYEVRLDVVCRECNARKHLCEAGLPAWTQLSLLKNLERLKEGGTSITWQLAQKLYEPNLANVFSAWPTSHITWESVSERLISFGVTMGASWTKNL